MRPHHLFLALALSSTRTTTARTASAAPPPHPATGLLSKDASTVYFFLPSSTNFRFVSLRLNATFSTENISSAFTELPAPPPPSPEETQATITPLLFSNPSSAGEDILDEKVVLFSGSCDAEVALYEYNLSDHKTGWKARDVVPAESIGRLDYDLGAPQLPKGRYYGRAFSYSIASTASTIAPSSTFMKGQAGEDQELAEYEQGVVVTTTTESKAYMFGGQCPTFPAAEEEGEDAWEISQAMYSGSLLAVEFPISKTYSFSPGTKQHSAPTMRGSNNPSALTAVISENTGRDSYGEWPIPEAGFSLTTVPTADTAALKAVVIGGHTAKAFVDMRQIAVYTVPAHRWSFIDIALPLAAPPKLSSSSTKVATDPIPTTETETTREDPSTAVHRRQDQDTEVKDTRRIDPRSGHTAVATADGKRIVVYGGWVGSTSTPAEPRLLVLELTDDLHWRWDIPYTRSSELGPPADGEDEGLSGHAAVMLEGDVMMLTSGYRISPFAGTEQVSERSFFYNVSSASWTNSYKPPGVLSEEAGAALQGAECDRARRTTGIVLGVVLGSAAAAAVVIGYFWYFRGARRRRGGDAEAASGGVYERPAERERWGSVGFYGKMTPSEERLGNFAVYNPSSATKNSSQERITLPYGPSAKSMSAERIGIVESRSHAYRTLGGDRSRSATPDHSYSHYHPTPRPPPKALLKTPAATRVSTIFEADEYDRRSSCGATFGSEDLADLYNRSLAFAEKMATQETIYEQLRERSSDGWSDTAAIPLPRPPPRAALSEESLMTVRAAPVRIPVARSFPPARAPKTRPRRTLLTPARFFPRPEVEVAVAAAAAVGGKRRVASVGGGRSPRVEGGRKDPRRWASIGALRMALPDILPGSPMSLWEGSVGKRSEEEEGSETTSIPIVLDTGAGGGFGVGVDEDWDLEAAIEKRVVQVMFTAPRGALRVVNLDERGAVEAEGADSGVGEDVLSGAATETEDEEEIVIHAGDVLDAVNAEVVVNAEGDILIDVQEGVVEMLCQ